MNIIINPVNIGMLYPILEENNGIKFGMQSELTR